MTKIIIGLEAAGLVRRGADRADARVTRLEATPRGVKLLQEGRRRRVGRLAEALATLKSDEIEVLVEAARLIEQVVPRL